MKYSFFLLALVIVFCFSIGVYQKLTYWTFETDKFLCVDYVNNKIWPARLYKWNGELVCNVGDLPRYVLPGLTWSKNR